MKPGNIVIAVLGVILRVVLVVMAAYFIYKGALACHDYGYRIFTEPAMSAGEGKTITVAVTEDMTPAQIGELFEKKGLVRDGRLFMLQYYLSEFRNDVKPGVFELSTAMTAEQMMEAMTVTADEDNVQGEE